MKRKRNTESFWFYNVTCQDCGWETYGKNGLGIAAQHHDRTGHTVTIDVEGQVKYLSEMENKRELEEKGDLFNDGI